MNLLKQIEFINLITGEEEEEEFQWSNTCWICEKLIDDDDKKVSDHYHVTGKFRGAAHWSMQFLNSSLDRLVKNLSDNDFKYLTEEFGSKNLELLKQKGVYPYEYINSFKRFNEKKLPDKECFYRSTKNGTTGDNTEKLDDHISDKEYLTCKNILDEFGMKNMGDCQDYYLKKDVMLLADVFEKFIETCLKF